MEFIKVPFGYLLDWLYKFAGNYGVALILFSLIIKVVLLPMNMKSKKSSLKMARVSPLAKALEAKYADDKNQYQVELMKLYKEEGISTMGGCLWSFVPLLIMLPLYYVIREPITYVMHIPADQAAQIVDIISSHVQLTGNKYYHQLAAAKYIGDYMPEILAFGTILERKSRASCINSSKCEDVCLRTAEANILRKSYSLRHEKMSRCTIRISSDCTSFATRFTNDVFPIRRGANSMVFTPYLKLLESTVISSLLPTKFSSSTATPNTNGFFIIFSYNVI